MFPMYLIMIIVRWIGLVGGIFLRAGVDSGYMDSWLCL